MHERKELVSAAVSEAWEKRGGDKLRNDVSFRADVARNLFKALTKEEQKQYADSSKRDKEAAVAAYKVAVENSLSNNRSPENRQL